MKILRILVTLVGFVFDIIGLLDRRIEIAALGAVIGFIDVASFIWLYQKKSLREILKDMYL